MKNVLKMRSIHDSAEERKKLKVANHHNDRTNNSTFQNQVPEKCLESVKDKFDSKKCKLSKRELKKREKKRIKKIKRAQKKSNILNIAIKKEKDKTVKVEPCIETSKTEIFNKEAALLFSKIKFPGPERRKNSRNFQEALGKVEKFKNDINELVNKGEKEKAEEIIREESWKKVFEKTQGKKVKDDPYILRKAIKQKKNKHKKSKTQWIQRKQKVQQDIEQRQKKRQENIMKRIKDKKVNKLKRLAKKGRIIPGY